MARPTGASHCSWKAGFALISGWDCTNKSLVQVEPVGVPPGAVEPTLRVLARGIDDHDGVVEEVVHGGGSCRGGASTRSRMTCIIASVPSSSFAVDVRLDEDGELHVRAPNEGQPGLSLAAGSENIRLP